MKAVIFDVDGTLVDSVDFHAEAWQAAFEHFGHSIPFDQMRSQIGKGGDQLMPVFLPKNEVNAIGKKIEKYRGDLFKEKYLGQVKSFPKVRILFQKLLQDGWKLALASSAKEDELEKYKEIVKIDDLLDTETSSDDADKSKPHPDIFQAAMKRLEVFLREIVSWSAIPPTTPKPHEKRRFALSVFSPEVFPNEICARLDSRPFIRTPPTYSRITNSRFSTASAQEKGEPVSDWNGQATFSLRSRRTSQFVASLDERWETCFESLSR